MAGTWRRMLAVGMCGATLLVLGAGCGGGSGLDLHPVSGTVTFDGQPVEDGYITFRAQSGDPRGFAGPIKQGKYTAETFAKPMKVSITAFRDVPGKFVQPAPDLPKEPAREQFIPARYNEATELQADIPSGGNKQLDFSLTSK